ncbi:MAG TPA: translation initiation factor IF-3 [Candidatus Saccharimonadales bacterium]|nr:translation initiation factor IF-3 [Candidatus Saccharimonadales bacterium]
MIKRHKKNFTQRKFYRTNDRIFAHTLRVLDSEGKQIGVLSKFDALTKAREEGLDLVEIAATAKPPVAKIIDFKKFLYQEEKKKREEKKHAKVSETKEVRLGPFMSDNDLNVMAKRAREFLEAGNKVRLVVRFSGRQIAHPEFGHQVVEKVFAKVADVAKFEREKHFEGRQLITILSADKKGKHEKENQEISSKTVQSNQDGQSAVLPPVQKSSEAA